MQCRQIVLVDTNVIIEAIRTNCWAALTGHYQIETVEKCIEEARTGDAYRAGYIKVTDRDLRERLIAHGVTNGALAQLIVREPLAEGLDPGEKHLWAHALGRKDAWVATTADGSAVRIAMKLGWGDRLVSLEELLHGCGAKAAVRALNRHFRSAALSGWRTQGLLT